MTCVSQVPGDRISSNMNASAVGKASIEVKRAYSLCAFSRCIVKIERTIKRSAEQFCLNDPNTRLL